MVRIGILSDSHGKVENTQRAVRLLIDQGADVLIHLGDIGSPAVLDALVEGVDGSGELQPPVHIVFGNTDWNSDVLERYAGKLGIRVCHPVGRLVLEGKTVVFQHGDCPRSMKSALIGEVDYLCHGHTHRRRDERIGPTRVINPGALHRARQYSVALLEIPGDRLRFVNVDRDHS